jgi:hypothetical protein
LDSFPVTADGPAFILGRSGSCQFEVTQAHRESREANLVDQHEQSLAVASAAGVGAVEVHVFAFSICWFGGRPASWNENLIPEVCAGRSIRNRLLSSITPFSRNLKMPMARRQAIRILQAEVSFAASRREPSR